LLADCGAQGAEVFAEAPDGGLKLRDAAQKDGSAESGTHRGTISKSGHPSKYGKQRQLTTTSGDGRSDSRSC
jgi:hypothetical protein